MAYDFTRILEREGRDSIAADRIPLPGVSVREGFSRIPMWIADMAFPAAPEIVAAMRARLDYPAISRGENEFLLVEGSACLMRRSHPDGDCIIAINFSAKDSVAVEAGPWQIAVDLEVGNASAALTEKNGVAALKLPPCAVVVLTISE